MNLRTNSQYPYSSLKNMHVSGSAKLTTPKSLIESSLSRNQKYTAHRRDIKTTRVVQRRKNHKNKRNKIENMWKTLIQLKRKKNNSNR